MAIRQIISAKGTRRISQEEAYDLLGYDESSGLDQNVAEYFEKGGGFVSVFRLKNGEILIINYFQNNDALLIAPFAIQSTKKPIIIK